MTDGDLAGVDRTAATDAGRGRLRAAAALATALGGAGYLYGHPPYGEASLVPPCPLRALTGLECPLCGATRMTYELLHGDPAAAFALNPVLLTRSHSSCCGPAGGGGRRSRTAVGCRG